MLKRMALLFVVGACLHAQNPATAVYPGGVATDKDLPPQVNRFQTTLTSDIVGSTTAIPLATTSGLITQTLITIDNEIMMVCQVTDGTHAAIGKSSCPNTDGRGLGVGGTAVSHSSLSNTKLVSGYLTAEQMNQSFAEIKALETNATKNTTFNAQTTTYQVLAADFTQLKTISVASGTFTITLVASGSQPAAGQFIRVINYGSGVVTIARSGQNINGATTSLTLPASTSTTPAEALIISDGTNYFGAVSGTTVPNAKGGTGGDSSSATGYAKVAAGTWSYAAITVPYGCAVGDPAGSALATGVLCYVVVPMAGTITGWDIVTDAGTATVDVWKIATGSAKPTVTNTITASALPAIASGTAIHSTTLTSWTTAVAANDILGFNYTTGTTPKFILVNLQIAH